MTTQMSTQTNAGEIEGSRTKEAHKAASTPESSSKEQGHVPPLSLTGTLVLCELQMARGPSDKLGSHETTS